MVCIKNIQQAVSWWTKAANQGNVDAMVHLADIAALPEEGEPDYFNAKYWWTKAAEAGDTYSMCRLGECLEKGWGTANPNLEDALKWYRLASQNGNEEAEEALKRFKKSLTGKIKLIKK